MTIFVSLILNQLFVDQRHLNSSRFSHQTEAIRPDINLTTKVSRVPGPRGPINHKYVHSSKSRLAIESLNLPNPNRVTEIGRKHGKRRSISDESIKIIKKKIDSDQLFELHSNSLSKQKERSSLSPLLVNLSKIKRKYHGAITTDSTNNTENMIGASPEETLSDSTQVKSLPGFENSNGISAEPDIASHQARICFSSPPSTSAFTANHVELHRHRCISWACDSNTCHKHEAESTLESGKSDLLNSCKKLCLDVDVHDKNISIDDSCPILDDDGAQISRSPSLPEIGLDIVSSPLTGTDRSIEMCDAPDLISSADHYTHEYSPPRYPLDPCQLLNRTTAELESMCHFYVENLKWKAYRKQHDSHEVLSEPSHSLKLSSSTANADPSQSGTTTFVFPSPNPFAVNSASSTSSTSSGSIDSVALTGGFSDSSTYDSVIPTKIPIIAAIRDNSLVSDEDIKGLLEDNADLHGYAKDIADKLSRHREPESEVERAVASIVDGLREARDEIKGEEREENLINPLPSSRGRLSHEDHLSENPEFDLSRPLIPETLTTRLDSTCGSNGSSVNKKIDDDDSDAILLLFSGSPAGVEIKDQSTDREESVNCSVPDFASSTATTTHIDPELFAQLTDERFLFLSPFSSPKSDDLQTQFPVLDRENEKIDRTDDTLDFMTYTNVSDVACVGDESDTEDEHRHSQNDLSNISLHADINKCDLAEKTDGLNLEINHSFQLLGSTSNLSFVDQNIAKSLSKSSEHSNNDKKDYSAAIPSSQTRSAKSRSKLRSSTHMDSLPCHMRPFDPRLHCGVLKDGVVCRRSLLCKLCLENLI
ncbi:unnamed protein product [Protopolystoma xenopodis]|uniref:Uncharacterized protein n=1 Tax=Protopolystoma xenopodis TaxID=117903 RepID=A0A448WNS2_9PLAT|nr:unnamed protein product [Protopolystoma xenopodis]